MKKLMLLGIAVGLFSACSSNQQGNKENDSTVTTTISDTTVEQDSTALTADPDAVTSMCFLNTEGKDSTSIEFVVKGNKVTGVMNWLPFEKDARKGKLEGIKRGDIIMATWSFMQEGVTDTMLVDFKLANNELAQKPFKLNKQTGRQQTDASSDYSIKYKPYNKVKK